jgi:hypothetical protein
MTLAADYFASSEISCEAIAIASLNRAESSALSETANLVTGPRYRENPLG